MSTAPESPHVAIGGVGGSGTQLIAHLTRELGVHIGNDLNDAQDNLAFTLLFKRREILATDDASLDPDMEIFLAEMRRHRPLTAHELARLEELTRADRPQHPSAWLAERANRMRLPVEPKPGQPWGWKEPNTHLLLPYLTRRFPTLRYVHVVRHGLDMAFSSNQNQLATWGELFRIPADLPPPARSLRYWIAAQRRARELGEALGSRFLWLDYDAFCASPRQGILRLSQFLQLPPTDPERLMAMVRPPSTQGRYRQKDCTVFPASDLDAVRELGFDVEV